MKDLNPNTHSASEEARPFKNANTGKPVANVALNIPRENLFSYLIPPGLEASLRPGHLVYIPIKNRKSIGLVIELTRTADDPLPGTGDLKEILALPYPDPVMDKQLIQLAKWISDYYLCPIGVTIKALIPTGLIPKRISRKEGDILFSPKASEKSIHYITFALPEEEIHKFIALSQRKAPKQCDLLKTLITKGGKASVTELSRGYQVNPSTIKALVMKGIIKRLQKRVYRDPLSFIDKTKEYRDITLTPYQQRAFERLCVSIDKGGFCTFLLHGITGSGKTEIYLRLIQKVLDKGLQAIILVPQIAITHQLIDRFKYHLGSRIAILHSSISDGERLDEWLRIKQGLADVVIGARSAIFAPLPRLGAIICDEEHDSSYKQESPPRYHGRDVAIMRAKIQNCLICLGSATPSLESYYNCLIKKYYLLTLPDRATTHQLPPVYMIDMKQEYKQLKQGRGDAAYAKKDSEGAQQHIFSQRFLDAMRETLNKGKQVLIFQNRRGYSPFLLCPKCGFVPKCPNCSISLTYHLTDNVMRCHYCDYQNRAPVFCIHCEEAKLDYMGYGTQKLAEEIKGIFSAYKVDRMDRDTTTRKGSHHHILSSLEKGDTDVLVGTQMVTKGLDMPNITLVGVIGVDNILNLPDFRATERCFQLITQVAGRAGRGDEPGKVLVQTFYPGHYSLEFATRHDYISFYNREIGFRRRLMYPPFSRIISIIIKGKEKKDTRKAALFFWKLIKESNKNLPDVRCLGPAMAPLFRLKGKYRYQIMIKSRDYQISHSLVRKALTDFFHHKGYKGTAIDIDVDPINML